VCVCVSVCMHTYMYIGTSLLFSAPESWLVGEHSRQGFNGKWLGQTFGLAYAGDSLVAIAAGQLAGTYSQKCTFDIYIYVYIYIMYTRMYAYVCVCVYIICAQRRN
jgi:hypothetical protein